MLDKPISPLRQRMIDDMTARRFNEHTQRDYVRHVRTFAAVLGRSPDTATSEDLRRYQLHMAKQAADERRVHQRRHRRVALLFRRDARTARPRSSSDDREQAAPSAGRAEPGGGGAS